MHMRFYAHNRAALEWYVVHALELQLISVQ
jgi:hypothetical protein